MREIETRLRFQASPREVFKALANPNNIPQFVPGIRSADVVELTEGGKGTRLSLTTRHSRRMEAFILEEAPNRFLSVQDDRGTLNAWEIRPTPDGTLAINRIVGDFSEEEARLLSGEAREKLHAFREIVEERVRLAP